MNLHIFDSSLSTLKVREALERIEGFQGGAYWDSAAPPRSTIGIGFNLETTSVTLRDGGLTNDNLRLVLEKLYGSSGIDIDGFVAAFRDPTTGIDSRRPTPLQVKQNTALYNSQLQSWLDDLVAQHLQPGQTFQPLQLTLDQARDVVTQILDGYMVGGIAVQGTLPELQDFLATNGISGPIAIPSNTNEGVALASLFYNKPELLGPNLLEALRTGDRAEAWYEIRYQSNGGKTRSDGIAKRRYFEAELFGLYDQGVTAANITDQAAKNVFRMYTQHRKEIQDYEAQFGHMVARANNDYALSGDPAVDTLTEAFGSARTYLVTTLAQGRTIDGEVLVGQDVATGVGDTLLGSLTVKNDLLFGEKGNDWLFGFQGEDVIYGGEGNDSITGGPGNDYLAGGPGNDTYYWNTGDGNDRIEDADGRDLIVADQRILVGGIHQTGDALNTFHSLDGTYTYVITGTDLLVHIGGATLTINENFASGQFGIRLIDATEADYTNGFPSFTDSRGDGNDTVALLGATNYTVHGNGGDDFIQTAQGNDQLFGDAGQDTLVGNSGDDRLYGGTENDLLFGDNDDPGVVDGDDYLEGNAGNDELVGSWGDDILLGGDGADTLWGDSLFKAQGSATAKDFLDGGAGDDTLHGLAGKDVLYGGADNDILFGEEDDDVLDGGTGDDLLLGYTGNDTLAGGEGTDSLYGDQGDDVLDGGAEADTLYGGDGADVIYGGAGADTIFGDTLNNPSEASLAGGADFLLGGDGNDHLEGGIGDDFLSGEADNDVLFGQAGADTLLGDAGDDELQGGADNDLLVGDAGNDLLFGDDGVDTLLGGDGADHLFGDAGDDVLEGGAGNDVLTGGAGSDTYVFNLGDGTDTIDDTSGDANRVIFGTGITADGLALGQGSLRIIVAATGDELHILNFDPTDPLAVNPISSFEFQDGSVLTSSELVAQGFDLIGTPANDFLSGGEVYPRVFGLAGDDTLTGGTGDNLLDGGAGNDQLFGAGGLDTLEGREGNDQLFGQDGDDVLRGGADIDYLSGGQGSDVLDGGAGDDYLSGDGGGDDALFGGAGNDTLSGAEGQDLLDGGTGDDFLIGSTGSDTYLFGLGSGRDRLQDFDFTGSDVDTIQLGEGVLPDDVKLHADADDGLLLRLVGAGDELTVEFFFSTPEFQVEAISFEEGSVWDLATILARAEGLTLTGTDDADLLRGGRLNDVLAGGLGDDTLIGGLGDDTYHFNLGDGADTIQDTAVAGAGNTLAFGAGITPNSLRLEPTPSALLLRVGEAGGLLRLSGFNPRNAYGPHAIDSFRFADGTVLSYSQLIDRGFDFSGTEGDDRLTGTNATDRMLGFSGQDTLRADSGNDVLDGGAGNDRLQGEAGNDTYVFERGSGEDTVLDLNGNLDTLRLGAGISPNDVSVIQSGQHLILSLNGTADRLTVSYFYADPIFQVEQVQFADGTVWDLATLQEKVEGLIVGTDGQDTLQGGAGTDTIHGLAGDDVLTGLGGDDRLDGGAGADSLSGGAGDDTYVVDNAADVVTEAVNEGTDTVESSITYALGANVEKLTLTGAAAISGTGNTLDNVLTGNDGANMLTGALGDDTYVVGPGDSVVEAAGAGTDTVQSSVSYTLGANVENLTLTGGAAISGTGNALDNVILGNNGVNVLTGGAGNDIYLVSPGDTVVELADGGTDTVRSKYSVALGANVENLVLLGMAAVNGTGNALDNVLTGNLMRNLLDGGPGDDVLIGGSGGDTYLVDSPNDVVVERDWAGADEVRSYVSYTLPAYVEYLTLLGDQPINGTGNDLPNIMRGNSADNVLDGAGGTDKYVLEPEGGNDIVLDFGPEGFFPDDVMVDARFRPIDVDQRRDGNDLILVLRSAPDQGSFPGNFFAGVYDQNQIGSDFSATIRIRDQFTGPYMKVEQIFFQGTGQSFALPGFEVVAPPGPPGPLVAGGENEVLVGGPGPDLLAGGLGDENYLVYSVLNQVVEAEGEGTDSVISAVDYTLPENVENLTLMDTSGYYPSRQFDGTYLYIGPPADRLPTLGIGNELDNELIGNQEDNVLEGGPSEDVLDGGHVVRFFDGDEVVMPTGNDLLIGGPGYDTYRFRLGDGVDTILDVSSPGEGNRIQFGPGITQEALTLTQAGTTLTIAVGTGGDAIQLLGFDPTNTNGSLVVETLEFSDGSQVNLASLLGSGATQGDDVITGTPGDDVIDALAGNDLVDGLAGNDTLTGGPGNDVLIGGAGADVLIGGTGDDTFVIDEFADQVIEAVNEGTDTVQSSITYTLAANVENLTLTGTANINGTGNAQGNVLTGNPGNNVLDGGAGADTMTGGTGDDTYVVDEAGDVVMEAVNEGTDTIQSAITYTLGVNVEHLTLTGTAAINGIGNALNNTITGNLAANVLDGGTGADTLIGGAGDDTYVVDQTGDVVTEQANEGVDRVQSSITYTLGANVENLTLTGTGAITGTGNALDNVLVGNSAANVLTGGAGNDVLDGGAGADTLVGGTGHDTYVVEQAGDAVTEAANEGTDTVQSSITYTLGANLENLTLTGGAAINGTGNALDNVLVGNGAANVLTGGAGNDVLTGGAGADTLLGGDGNDTLYIDAQDTSIDGGAGVDTVIVQGTAGVTLNLGTANIETALGGAGNDTFTKTGAGAVTIFGNGGNDSLSGGGLADTLDGGDGNDTLSGGGGADLLDGGADNDSLSGGDGNDTLYGRAGDDTLTGDANDDTLDGGDGNDSLNGGGGNDVLYGGAGQDLLVGAANADTLDGGDGNDTLDGGDGNDILYGRAGDDTLTGAANADTLDGGDGNDTLDGGDGNDTLAGGHGNDTVTGGTGNDTYQFNQGDGQDVVSDLGGTSDAMAFGTGLDPLDLVLERSVNDLRISIHGSSDRVTIQSWYSGASRQTEKLLSGNGQELLNTQVDQLIQAMAGYSQTSGLSWDQAVAERPQEVQAVLAAHWHAPQGGQ